jgi:RNA polymerase sigma factor (sigma-70 family)
MRRPLGREQPTLPTPASSPSPTASRNGPLPTPRSIAIPTDTELLQRYVGAHDQAAFATLVHRYGTAIYRSCLRQLADPSGADDAAQATFLVLERRAPELVRAFRSPELSTWLFRTARLVCANALRHRSLRRHHERAAADALATARPRADDGSAEPLARVGELIEHLPAKYREVLVLRYLVGRSRKDIAAELGLEDEAVKKRLARGLALLRAALGSSAEASIALLLAVSASTDAHAFAFGGSGASARAVSLANRASGWAPTGTKAMAGWLASLAGAAALVLVGIGASGGTGRTSTGGPPEQPIAQPTIDQTAPSPAAVAPPYGLRVGDLSLLDSVCIYEVRVQPGASPAGAPGSVQVVEHVVYRVDVTEAGTDSVRVAYTPLLLSRSMPSGEQTSDEVAFTRDDGSSQRVRFSGPRGYPFPALDQPTITRIGPGQQLRTEPADPGRPQGYDNGVNRLPMWLLPAPAAPRTTASMPVSVSNGDWRFPGTVSAGAAGTIAYRFPDLRLDRYLHFAPRGAQELWLDGAGRGDIECEAAQAGTVPSWMRSVCTYDVALPAELRSPPAHGVLRRDVRVIRMPTQGAEPAESSGLIASRIAALAEDPSSRLQDAPEWAVGPVRAAAFASLRTLVHHGLPARPAPPP